MLKWVVFSKPQEFRKRVVVSEKYYFIFPHSIGISKMLNNYKTLYSVYNCNFKVMFSYIAKNPYTF